eukprot:825458-Prymnesium_polylepis.2
MSRRGVGGWGGATGDGVSDGRAHMSVHLSSVTSAHLSSVVSLPIRVSTEPLAPGVRCRNSFKIERSGRGRNSYSRGHVTR